MRGSKWASHNSLNLNLNLNLDLNLKLKLEGVAGSMFGMTAYHLLQSDREGVRRFLDLADSPVQGELRHM